ncbi:hypothetical protein LTR36_000733 [Oleoguttula mirabilis]|uniref:DUF676 domain-containing protein n=1 Tax=Oleoguttula mirabilis TaxID=1507867 RepID=A0AAV9JS19_9PEZI|nr:hypothetical protein LTR36_000733 [Oleoguttula mirabilis]
MLLVHQAGSVKVGEVIRYTITYTPSNDRILPTPTHLHVKVKNTSAIPLRAAWLHGPYILHVSAYPATFNPHHKEKEPQRYGEPDYEPMLKAGGSWQFKLTIPDEIRETGADLGKRRHSAEQRSGEQDGSGSMTWIVEIASQIMFSASASVNFEVLIGRDERSLDLGFVAVAGHGHGVPGQIKEQQQSEKERKRARRHGNVQTAGVYSKAVRLVVEDTETLWDKPALPSWDKDPDAERRSMHEERRDRDASDKARKTKKRKKIHLVVLTHGLHSNIGADMLFLKESIDATVAQARLDAKKRKESYRKSEADKKKSAASEGSETPNGGGEQNTNEASTAPLSGGQEEMDGADEDDDEEETIVRGFTGNAVKTENGIQYLGKRLAKYILRFTYPDQPFLPVKKPLSRQLTDTFKSDANKAKRDGHPAHLGSSIHHPEDPQKDEELPYTFTSISFVGHSLGGLIQTYAVAYIHKHSPTFFQQIKPVNFICMASPMLGLSNENPLYVKFALDFGLVGRTGQDLGLSFRPTRFAKGGWNAVLGGLGAGQQEQKAKEEDPSAKPLLRILPTGPAHQVLRMFRNRTLYSNVVNDGIVPLRTSCLLFLDWRGLGKVEKARRENGLIGTVAEWGWAEITGANSSTARPKSVAERYPSDEDEDDKDDHIRKGEGETVPQPAEDETAQDSKRPTNRLSFQSDEQRQESTASDPSSVKAPQQEKGMFDSLFDFFKPNPGKPPPPTSKKTTKALRRGQTVHQGEDELPEETAEGREGTTSNPTMRPHMSTTHAHAEQGQQSKKRPQATKGDSYLGEAGALQAPPKTSIFESAGDILHPPLPSRQWITDPSSRARTIFHDRVYHPEDIPPPPIKRPGSRLTRSFSSETVSKGSQSSGQSTASRESMDSSAMKVEEKIARAYHRDLSWRKVLVRLEPDAHNNMIVRRMFANAYGWPVVKHLCDTHFADTYAARTRDEEEPARERAQPLDMPVPETGEEVRNQTAKQVPARTRSETREARDELAELKVPKHGADGSYSSAKRSKLSRENSAGSAVWDDSFFDGSDGEDSETDERNLVQRLINPMPIKKPEEAHHRPSADDTAGSDGARTLPYFDGHRGLAPTSPTSVKTPVSARSAASTRPLDSGIPDSPSTPVVTDQLVAEPESLEGSPGSTAQMGLRKSIAEQISPTKSMGKQ